MCKGIAYAKELQITEVEAISDETASSLPIELDLSQHYLQSYSRRTISETDRSQRYSRRTISETNLSQRDSQNYKVKLTYQRKSSVW